MSTKPSKPLAGLWCFSPEGAIPVPLEHVQALCDVRQECARVTLTHKIHKL
eukprot:TRINITY_DN376_c0_g1_i1.p4 TRINITY_DN376_c0_g1~~TRINITY_DN376_c0_g1_i1.p4  ORF type:complete len:51 (-),score=5.56 TRINITY_DN376_c0_g1_i1:224-376(-)